MKISIFIKSLKNIYRYKIPLFIRTPISETIYKFIYFPKYISYTLSMKFLIRKIIENKLSCVQIGAGAGSLDPKIMNDGFHKVIRSVYKYYKPKIHLYEPNPINQKALKRCWERFNDNSKIFQEGISHTNKNEILTFYFHPLDKPNYQVCSTKYNHVLKHFEGSSLKDLEKFKCHCIKINELFERILEESDSNIFIAIDVEGIDYITVKNILNSSYINKCSIISFEKLHFDKINYHEILELAKSKGFFLAGLGVDTFFYDELLVKKELVKFDKHSFKIRNLFLVKTLQSIFKNKK